VPAGTFPAANLDNGTMPLTEISTAPFDWPFPFREYHLGLPLSPFSPLKTPPLTSASTRRVKLAHYDLVRLHKTCDASNGSERN
jgi:hypothetical protein